MTKIANTKSDTEISLVDAFLHIGNELVDMQTRNDRATGQPETVNVMGFAQRRILSGFCWVLDQQIKDTNESLAKAARELQSIIRGYRGDEISKKNLESKQSWIERLQTQELTLSAVFADAKIAHEALTGEVYVDAASRRAIAAQEVAAKGALPELAEATKLLASLGVRESAHPAKAMDRQDRVA